MRPTEPAEDSRTFPDGGTVAAKHEILSLLLNHGADVNLSFGGDYGTALGVAAYAGRLEVVILLLGRGANASLGNKEGSRPRDLAEQEGHQAIVELLARARSIAVRLGVGTERRVCVVYSADIPLMSDSALVINLIISLSVIPVSILSYANHTLVSEHVRVHNVDAIF